MGSSNSELKNLYSPHRAGYEPSKACSKSFQFSVENIIFILKSFLSLLSQRKGIEKNLLAKKFIKDIFHSKENIKITLFYSENLRNLKFSQIQESPALRQQGGAKILSKKKENSIFSNKSKFVSETTSGRGGTRTLTGESSPWSLSPSWLPITAPALFFRL